MDWLPVQGSDQNKNNVTTMDQLPVHYNNMNTMDWLPLHGRNHHYADNINRRADIVK